MIVFKYNKISSWNNSPKYQFLCQWWKKNCFLLRLRKRMEYWLCERGCRSESLLVAWLWTPVLNITDKNISPEVVNKLYILRKTLSIKMACNLIDYKTPSIVSGYFWKPLNCNWQNSLFCSLHSGPQLSQSQNIFIKSSSRWEWWHREFTI